MAKLNFKKNDNFNVQVSSIFIDKFLPKANGSFVKVYLYGLMHSSIPNSNITVKDIAHALDMLESDVYKAWNFWENEGVVKINKNMDNNILDITFLDLSNIEKIEQTKPNYSPKEIDIYINNNSEIKHLFNIAQKRLGKTFTSNDASTLYSFYDWLKLPVEVIIMLLEYCYSIGKTSMRYIEKVAIDWAEKGIDSTHKAEEHLKKLEDKNSNLNIIKKALGITDRVFTSTELNYIDKWINTYNFNVEIIKLACEQTILNTGKASIKYTDSILEEWYKNNVTTLEQAQEQINNFKNKNKQKFSKNPKKQSNASNNKFLNFSHDNYDVDEFMERVRKKNINEEGGSS